MFARYATIYSQQVQAINLVDSLCRSGELAKNTTLAVVGGSAAGLTAAVAAALRALPSMSSRRSRRCFPFNDTARPLAP